MVVWKGYQPSDSVVLHGGPTNVTLMGSFSATEPLVLPACNYSDFGLHHIAPVHPLSNAALLGEIGKWVPIAHAGRITSLTDAAEGLSVGVAGVPGELVELAFGALDAPTAVSVVCTMGAAGTASAKFNGKQATCL